VAYFLHETTGNDETADHAKHIGYDIYTGPSSGMVSNGLEEDWKIIDSKEHIKECKECSERRAPLCLSFEKNERHHGFVANMALPGKKEKEYDWGDADQRDDRRIIPWALVSTPLESLINSQFLCE